MNTEDFAEIIFRISPKEVPTFFRKQKFGIRKVSGARRMKRAKAKICRPFGSWELAKKSPEATKRKSA